jgi:serine/threonine protein kinase/Tfp pilus assembly protein PilF
MGEVYRARDSRLERQVAVKVLPEHLSQCPQALSRFVRETKAVAALSHPNLLAIFDTGVEGGISYAVTELLEGESLRARLQRGPIPWRNSAEIGGALAEGLAAAHSKGITHRDLKPENIFLTVDGRFKILDFGLARVEAAQTDGAGDTQTQAGTVLGTPAYMSPEQVRGTATPVSDIFSLGCVLYEMISGRRAFQGQTTAEIMSSVLRDTPRDLSASGPQIPAELERLIFSCLEKNCEQRFQSAHDLALHFKAVLNAPVAASLAAPAIDSIAVLPFANASNDADAEYLCDGITESILNSLTRIAQLRVTPRSVAFRYKTRDFDPQNAGRELGVRLLLTGRVIQRGDSLVVSTELVDIAAESQLWGERYVRKLSDIFALEEEIAKKIFESLRVKLNGQQKVHVTKRSTENSEAYQLYLRGRHHWVKRTPEHVKKGLAYFQKAIDTDPGYALAYSGLADCYSILGTYSMLPAKETLARAKAAAVAAVAFDDQSAEGYASLGFIRWNLDWDWSGSERDFKRALELNPGYWVAPNWYALMLTCSGRFEEAEEQIRRAIELEPLSPFVMHMAAINSYFARRYTEAAERCLKGIEIDPQFFPLHAWLGGVHLTEGKYREAISELRTSLEQSGGVLWTLGALGYGLAVAGERTEALQCLEDLLDRAKRETVDFLSIALIYAGLRDAENAIASLDKACDSRGLCAVMAKADPRLDFLRSEPGFHAILKKMNLA